MCTVEKWEISYEILAYLAEHPRAQDTLEGVTEWWLLEQKIKDRMDRVREAIGDLVLKRLVLEQEGRDGRLHYRINRRRLGKITEILRRGPAPDWWTALSRARD